MSMIFFAFTKKGSQITHLYFINPGLFASLFFFHRQRKTANEKEKEKFSWRTTKVCKHNKLIILSKTNFASDL
jgi:hypothetical protein